MWSDFLEILHRLFFYMIVQIHGVSDIKFKKRVFLGRPNKYLSQYLIIQVSPSFSHILLNILGKLKTSVIKCITNVLLHQYVIYGL